MKYANGISFIFNLILSIIIIPMLFNMLKRSNIALKSNYKNYKIPVCMGVSFVLIQTISLAIIAILSRNNSKIILSYLFILNSMGLVGLLDDLIGNDNIKGIRGHMKSFFMGDLTTGAIKAVMGFITSLFISLIISNDPISIIVNLLIISLFTNLINLFDLRPGRSSKVFILISIIMLYSKNKKDFSFLLYSFYGILVVYLPLDLKEKTMMGDVGSNVLGVTLGVFCSLTHSLSIKYLYLAILIIIHIVSERRSFSQIIENNRILSFIDNMGR